MATVRSQINDFEIEEFFRSLTTLLISSFNDNVSFDLAEYISRRLDLYERNLRGCVCKNQSHDFCSKF